MCPAWPCRWCERELGAQKAAWRERVVGREADVRKCMQKRVHALICVHTDIPLLWGLGPGGPLAVRGLPNG